MLALEVIQTAAAAKDALDGDISDELTPFSDLKPRMNQYIMEHGQPEWDERRDNKLHQTETAWLSSFTSFKKKRKSLF